MATAQEIIDSVREDVAIDPGKNIWSDLILLKYLNEAISVSTSKGDFNMSLSESTIDPLVDGQDNYDYAANYRKLLWAKLVNKEAASTQADETPLQIVTDNIVWFKESRDMDYQSDTPAYIYEENGEFKLWPIPNSDAVSKWTIKYGYSDNPDAVGFTDTPEYPAKWNLVLEHYMRYKMWSKPGAQNAAYAASAFTEYQFWEPKARADIYWRTGDKMSYKMPILPRKRNKI